MNIPPIMRCILLIDIIASAACAEAPATRPSFVVILIDDLRYDALGYMKHLFVKTPHIDALATGGMQFENAFVTTSLCSPSRASFLTGQYMHHHQVVDNASRIPEDTVTFPQQLQASGYETAFIGKWHMGGSVDAPQPGFDRWVSFAGQGSYAPEGHELNVDGSRVPRRKYMTDELTDYAVQWLADRGRERPFLLYLSHKGVHGLYDPAPRHRDLYLDEQVTLPRAADAASDQRVDQPMWVGDQRNSWHGVEFPYYGRSGETLAEMYKHYCEMILSVDDSVGRVMRVLQEQGLEQSTLVLFTSDGGHLWGEHGLIDKRCAYEESIRVPFLIHWPATIDAGSTCSQLVANIDVAPTFLELAGLETRSAMDGHSLAGLINNPTANRSWRDALLYEYYWEPQYPQTPTTFALRGARYKLIQYHGIWDLDELYDLADDPGEKRNLINDPAHHDLVARLRHQLYEQLKSSGGLSLMLGFKRSQGTNLRSETGSKRAEFPSTMLEPRSASE